MSRDTHSIERRMSCLPAGRGPQTVGELLMEQRLLTEERFRSAQETARRRMVSTEDILREEGLVTDALLREALMEHYRVPAMGQRSLFPQTGMATIIGDFLRTLKERRLKADFLRTSHRTEEARLREERARRLLLLKRYRVLWRSRARIERGAMRREERDRKAEMERRKHEERRMREEEQRKAKEAEKERERAAAQEERRRKEEEQRRQQEEQRAKREASRRAKEEERKRKAQEQERKRAEKRAAREAAKKQRADERQRRRDEKRSAPTPLPITVQGIVTTQQVPTAATPHVATQQAGVVVAAPTVVRQVLPPTTEEQSAVAALREEIASLKEENRNLRDALESAGRERTVVVEKEVEVPAQGRGMTSVETDGAALADLQRKYEDKLRMQKAKFDAELGEERKKLADAQRDATVNTAGGGGETAVERERLEAQQKELEREKLRLRAERETFEKERGSAAPASPAPAATEGGRPSAGDREALLQELRKEHEEELRKQRAAFEVEREELIREAAKAKTGVSGGAELTRVREEAKAEAEGELQRERTKWEIEKERIKQQAIAEAESGFLSKMKGGGGIFGNKQKSALADEIAQWKAKAEKLERERLELEQQRALHEEQVRMREKERQIEQEKLRIEREKIAKEKEALASEETHEEILGEEREKIQKERQELEEAKKTREKQVKEARKAAKKAQKEKRGFFGGKKQEAETTDATTESAAGEAPGTGQPAMDIGNILLAQNYIEEGELESAKAQAQERHVSLESVLREEGLVTKELMQNAIAEHYRMPFVDLSAQPPDTEVVEMLPEEIATYLRAIAIEKKDDGSLVVATSDPSQGDMIKEEVKKALPEIPEVTLVYTSKDAIESALSFYRKALNTRFSRIIGEHKKIAPEILEEIFADAVQLGASDIHFEPQEKIIIVRFRVDGVMHEAGRLPKEYYEGIVNRVKIAGNMRIDEHFAAQDGAIRWKSGDRAMDVRVSIVPIVDGEKVVMRLLSEYVRTLTLRDLGFAARHLETLVKMAHKPFGMILTTGPTGSGKSTTLYGLMKIRNSPDVNISTIEDPVEYKIPGINHIQVNPKSNLTFERGLRALVRQDPDIILVGEIRDDITAQISVNAALTGHLLFSTLHANDAATAIPRLLEMGIEPYLLGSTLELIIAQRLMRRICTNCRYSYTVSPAEAGQLFANAAEYFTEEREMVTLYRGKGCSACGETGYKGRVGVYEILPVTTEIEEAVVARRTSGDINIIARSQGMLTLFEDGLEKALYGLSTIEELLRVAAPPEPLP